MNHKLIATATFLLLDSTLSQCCAHCSTSHHLCLCLLTAAQTHWIAPQGEWGDGAPWIWGKVSISLESIEWKIGPNAPATIRRRQQHCTRLLMLYPSHGGWCIRPYSSAWATNLQWRTFVKFKMSYHFTYLVERVIVFEVVEKKTKTEVMTRRAVSTALTIHWSAWCALAVASKGSS